MIGSTIIVIVFVALVVAYVIVHVGWRWASRRTLLPCPSSMAWSLQGGFVDWWAATQRTLDRIELRPGDHVLEVGPGPGRLLIPAADRVLPDGKVVGLDVQPGMVDRLNSRATKLPNLTVLVGNAEDMPFESNRFDVVYLVMVLGEIPNRPAALAQCFRVLKPGGRLSITEMLADPHFQSQTTVARLAADAGFEAISTPGRWYSFTANFMKPRD